MKEQNRRELEIAGVSERVTERGPRKRGTFRKESVKLEQVCSRGGEGWRKRQNHRSWLCSPSEHAQAANYHLCTVLKQEWLVCRARATPKLSEEPTGHRRGPATKKNRVISASRKGSVPALSGQRHDQKAPRKWLDNNADIQDGTERSCKRLWKGKHETDGTTASTTVRLNDSWAGPCALSRWQPKTKEQNKMPQPNQNTETSANYTVWPTSRWCWLGTTNLTLEILKIHIFSWLVFRKRSCQSRGFSGWLKAVLFWGNCNSP